MKPNGDKDFKPGEPMHMPQGKTVTQGMWVRMPSGRWVWLEHTRRRSDWLRRAGIVLAGIVIGRLLYMIFGG